VTNPKDKFLKKLTLRYHFPKPKTTRVSSFNSLGTTELSIKCPSVSPPYSSAFVPYPLFQWYPQSKEILLNLGVKCWKSAFNAQGSRVIIVIVQVGAVKIYVAAVEALWKKRKDRMKLSLPPKLVEKLVLGPSDFLL
jgi:hypothetical protein